MIETLSIILGLVLAIHLFRQYWFNRQLPQVHCMESDGKFYSAGETSLAIKRPESGATRTLLCFPGFLEDTRYFLSLYERRGYEGFCPDFPDTSEKADNEPGGVSWGSEEGSQRSSSERR